MTVIITDKGKCSCNKKERDSQGNEVTEKKVCKDNVCMCNLKSPDQQEAMDYINRGERIKGRLKRKYKDG